MPRNRSRSRSRERRRSRSRERNSRRDPHKRNRSRSPRYRSRSPVGTGATRRRSRSHSPRRRSQSPRRRSRSRERTDDKKGHSSRSSKPQIDESQLKGMTEEEAEMMRTMGFAGFDTTKGKKVDNNNIYVAKLTQKRRYRQYMNRRGGFNRPLDFIA